MVRMDDLQVFVTTVEAGSFSAASRQLDISPALASGAVQRLERSLGIRLFVRSTRKLRLSDDGQRYLPHARQVLEALSEGELALADGREEIAGALRLSMPSDLGRNLLLPWLDEFQAAHPRIELQLRLSDQVADFFSDRLDAGIRYGQLADSSLVALPLAANNRRILCAAPMVAGDRTSDDADVVRRWAVAGLGVVFKSQLDVRADLEAGRLVELFPRAWGQPTPLHLVCAHRQSLTPVVQQLRAFLLQRLQALGD
ncbi:MAG: LysR family transcriptional regulator [Pseudomonas sp.]|nr:MAG: LysR family transcriptional regulator [Pseudomonas sp.]